MQTLIRAALSSHSPAPCLPASRSPNRGRRRGTAEEAEEGSSEHLLEACTIKITEPEQSSWTTYWDARNRWRAARKTRAARARRTGPTKKSAETSRQTNSVEPLTIRCSSDESPNISISFSSYTSPLDTVPLNSASTRSLATAIQPGQFEAEIDHLRSAHDRADYRLAQHRPLRHGWRARLLPHGWQGGGRRRRGFRFEGTFDIPCRGGPLESACEPTSRIQPSRRVRPRVRSFACGRRPDCPASLCFAPEFPAALLAPHAR